MARFPVAQNVKVVVLSLRQSIDRQAQIKKLLEEAGVAFEFFWGVDGRKDRDPCLALYNKAKRLKTKGQPMTPGQLGCFASHFNIWKSCVMEDNKYIVLEDDAVFDKERFWSFLEVIHILPVHVECLRLFENKTRNHKEYKVAEVGPFSVLRYTKGPMSTMGYYLTPNAARKFLASADPLFLPVDIYMDRYWVNDVVCLGISPAFVFHDLEFESTIGYEEKVSRRPFFIRLNRELFTLTERVRRFFYNFCLSGKFKSKRSLRNGR